MKKETGVQTIGEEISNAITHGVGVFLSIAGMIVMIVRAVSLGTAIDVVASVLYGSTLILLYTFSTLYHSITNKKAKFVFKVLDHCSIFLLILGSYIPVSLCLIGGAKGWVLFGINAAAATLGIVLNSINLVRWKTFSMVLYIVMGWSIVMSITDVLSQPVSGIVLIASGGIAYTAGILFYKDKKHKFAHFVWHLFVLAGSILQYFFMLFYCI